MTAEIAFQDELVTLYVGDCAEVMPSIEGGDLAMVDPPYGDTALEWDRVAVDWLPSIESALKPAGSLWLWGSMRYLLAATPEVLAAGWRYSQDVVWEKHNGSNSSADRFRRVHEGKWH